MSHKITVGLQQKTGQPNYGSLGASCAIEVQVSDDDLERQEVLTAKIRRAYAACRQSINDELAMHHRDGETQSSSEAAEKGEPASATRSRPATDAQVRAIRAIASKAGVQLASELNSRFGVRSPNQLSLGQASQMIDELKSQLQPTST